MLRKLNPRLVYYVMSGSIWAANSMLFTVLSIYYIQSARLDPLQLVLVGTVLEAVYLSSEVPTGVIADTYSRRLSVILGMFVLGAAYLLEGSLPLFAAILVAEGIRAVGEALNSGANQAWLADEVGEENVGPVLLRTGQIGRICGILGTLSCMALASWKLNLPILIGGGLYIGLGIFLVLFMGETGFKPTRQTERNTWRSMTATFRQGAGVLRRSHVLVALLLVSMVLGISSEGFDRLWEVHMLNDLTFPSLGNLQPVVWFGALAIVGDLFSLVVTEMNRRRLERVSQDVRRTARWLMSLSLLTVFCGLGLAWAGSFGLAVGVLLARGVVGALYWPLYDTWLIQHIPPEVRATVISTLGQANAIGQVAGGPGVGAVGKFVSIRAALTLSALLFLPAPALYGWVLRKEIDGRTAAPVGPGNEDALADISNLPAD